jgi:glycosyltransferase involved in cell wall biosynthesis
LKLIFLNRFFHPDHSATSQILSDLAFGLTERGWTVAVITSRQRYDAPSDTLPPAASIGGVSVHRIWTSHFGRFNLVGRAVDYLSFYVGAAWSLWRIARPGDAVISKTDPPMLSVITGPVCRLRRARLINWLQDIFPEVAEELGFTGVGSRLGFGLLRWLRNRSLRRADCNVAVGNLMGARLASFQVEKRRIRVIPNWADGERIAPIEPVANELRSDWKLDGSFVIGYSGNLGRAHEIETLLEAISRIERDPQGQQIGWLFIGDGTSYRQLQLQTSRRGLTSVQFRPYQPRERLAQSLSAADVHLVSLRPRLEGLIVPSKFYGIAAAGRPAIFIGHPDGEIAHLIRTYACGLVVREGDGTELAAILLRLARDIDECRRMGARARTAFMEQFNKQIGIARWERLLRDLLVQPVSQPPNKPNLMRA